MEGGFRSVFRGWHVTFWRGVVASFFYFSSYEYLKHKLTPEGANQPPVLGILTAGGLAGIANWIGALPLDAMKSRFQTAPEGTYTGTVFGARPVYKAMLAEGGVSAFYRGIQPVLLRAFPANAACFLGYEATVALWELGGLE